MKKIISMLLIVTMVFSLLTGCVGDKETANSENDTGNTTEDSGDSLDNDSASSDSGKASGEVNVMIHMTQLIIGDEKQDENGNTYRDASTAWLKFAAEDFTEETGIKVNLIPFADLDEDIKPLLQVSDESVDIFTNPGVLSREEREMYLEPLMSVDDAKKIYDEKFVDSMTKNTAGDQVMIWSMGKVYNNGIAYNENAIKAVGYDAIPDTLDEFIVMCEKLRDAGTTPISLHRVENWPLATVGEFADYIPGKFNTMSELLTSEAPFGEGTSLGQMIKIYTDFKSRKFFEQEIYADFGVAMDSVAHGDAAMMLFGSWVVPQLKSRVLEGTDPSDIKFDAAVDYGTGRHIAVASEFAWGLSKTSKNQENAKLFLDYISKNSDLISKAGFINGRTDVDPIVPDLYAMIDEKIEAGTVEPIYSKEKSEEYYKVEEILTDADLFGDYKYVGLLFDTYDVENPSWDAFNKQVETQNKLFFDSKDFLGY
jgi:raffinose/stachyose/melibiose transport system substrate-binding protein